MAKKKPIKHAHRSQAAREAIKARRGDIASDVATMAKRANQRLRELEKRGLTEASHAYRYVERLEFDADSATAHDKKGRIKWNTNTRGKSYQQLQHEKAELERFLNQAKTSTVRGTLAQFEKGYQTYAEKAATAGRQAVDRSTYGDIWRMRNIKRAKEIYGSSETIRIVERAQARGLSIEEIDRQLDTLPEDTTIMELEEKLKDLAWHNSEELGGFDPFRG